MNLSFRQKKTLKELDYRLYRKGFTSGARSRVLKLITGQTLKAGSEKAWSAVRKELRRIMWK